MPLGFDLEDSCIAFPLTPTLSLGERENHSAAKQESLISECSNAAEKRSLSPRERAGVRGA